MAYWFLRLNFELFLFTVCFDPWLESWLYNFRALGYFAVVTGMDDPTASINQIQRHESSVLETSELFRSGILKSDQLGTLNMCDMVSKTFWNLVKSSLRGELEKLQDHLFALETEWRNKFRNVRELDRFQLFEKVILTSTDRPFSPEIIPVIFREKKKF